MVRLILASVLLLMLALPTTASLAQTDNSDSPATSSSTENFLPRKVSILYPRPGTASRYASAFDQALAAVADDVRAAGGRFPLEIGRDALGKDEPETLVLLNSLVEQEVVAVIAPALQLEVFNASPGKFDTRVVGASQLATNTVALLNADPAQTLQTIAEPLQNVLHQLRFSGQVKKLVLLYDPVDNFSQACASQMQKLLERSPFNVAERTFTSGLADFSSMVNGIKLAYPDATLFLCAHEADVKPIITQAHQKTNLKNRIVGLSIGSSALALDLSDGLGNGDLSKLTHTVAAPEAIAGKLAEKFPNDQLAAQVYVGLWTMAVNASLANADGNATNASLLSDVGPNTLIESQSGKLALLGLFLPEVLTIKPEGTPLAATAAITEAATPAAPTAQRPDATPASQTALTTTTALSITTPAPLVALPTPTVAARRYKAYGAIQVCAIHVGAIDDLGYNQAHHDGLQEMAERVSGVRLTEVENVPESEAVLTVVDELVQNGCQILFGQSYGYLPYLLQAAERYPQVTFLHPGGAELRPNLGTYWLNDSEAMYLAGIAAGATSKNGKLGFVTAFPIANLFSAVNAFHLGARSVNPAVTTQVVLTGAWVDPVQESAAVNALADAGVDTIAMIVDAPSVVVETAEQRGLYVVGFQSASLQKLAPKGWLTAVAYTWGNYYTQVVEEVTAGRWQAEHVRGGIESDMLGLAPFGPAVTAKTQAQIATAKTNLIRGKLSVFQGPLIDNQGNERLNANQVGGLEMLDIMDWLVEGVSQLDLAASEPTASAASASSPNVATPTPTATQK